jgi:hypothetical protein
VEKLGKHGCQKEYALFPLKERNTLRETYPYEASSFPAYLSAPSSILSLRHAHHKFEGGESHHEKAPDEVVDCEELQRKMWASS